MAVIAGVICFALCAYWFGSVVAAPGPQDPSESGKLISAMYDPPTNAIENALVKGDGQLFAGQATDPLVRHPEMVRGGENEQAYRYQRPMYGWLGFVASGGQRDAVAWALVAVTALSTVLLTVAVATWLADRGADPRWALAVLAMPGVFVDLTWVGPESLGVALVVLGLYRWMGVRRTSADADPQLVPASPDWVAVACFAAAGLCRETLLLVPFVLMVAAAIKGRWGSAVAAALAAAPYVAWVGFLFVRIGSLPKGSVGGRLSILPFGGLFEAASGWGAGDYVFAAAIVGLAVIALVVGARSGLRPLIAAHLLLAATLGEPVWHRFPDFGRVLLPLGVLSLLAAVPALAARKAPAGARSTAAGGESDDLASVGSVHPAT